ncbi:MAG: hypothetical protein AB7O78_13420 [Thermoleophilia bacterium]
MRGGDALRTPGRRLLAGLVAGAAAALWLAAPAGAVPSISGADGDVWNAASPDVRYVITSNLTTRITWTLEEVQSGGDGTMATRTGAGAQPVTVTAPTGDGTFRITARDFFIPAQRTFVVDRTPPGIRIAKPADGSTVPQGAAAVAEYSCAGAVRCAGTVASGARLDTSRPGPVTVRVEAADAAGNTAVAQATLTVAAPPAAGGTPPAPPDPAAPAAPVPPAPPGTVLDQPDGQALPTRNHARLLPRLNGVVATRRPVLRWPPKARARLFNVQVFRLRDGGEPQKVASLFPRVNRVRIPPGRLKDGGRYAWRVWPFLSDGYTVSPLGLSVFAVDLARR